MIYIICKEGVYRHELAGAFTSKVIALAKSKELNKLDDYHYFSVVELVTDALTPAANGSTGFQELPSYNIEEMVIEPVEEKSDA